MADDQSPAAEEKVRKLIDDCAQAIRDKDVGRTIVCYARDSLVFDLAPPLRHGGGDAGAREGLAAWFDTWKGPISLEIADLNIAAGGDIAYATSLNRLSGTKTDGETPDVWFRATYCLRKQDNAWKIAHEHTSVPFYMDGSYKAAVDLQP